jgi:hypothetical protein
MHTSESGRLLTLNSEFFDAAWLPTSSTTRMGYLLTSGED